MSAGVSEEQAAAEEATAAVAVVIPLYNGGAHIAQTLSSLQQQTRRPRQVIVVDDGSSDGGADIVHAHPLRPILVSQRNHGVAVARNHGLSLVTQPWVAFLDQDDLWHPEHLARSLVWLADNPDARLVFLREIPFTVADDHANLSDMDALAGGWAQIIAPRIDTLAHLVGSADVTGSADVERHDLRAVLRGPISTTTSFIADTALLRMAGGFAPHAPAMDDYWLLANIARLVEIPQIDQPTVFYRVHSQATSRTARLGFPFLSSAVALRFGGAMVPIDEALRGQLTGGLHRHLLGELLDSPAYRQPDSRRAVDALARLLWPPDGLRLTRRRARLAAELPWLRSAMRRIRKRP